MMKQDLAQKLNSMYHNAPQGEKVLMIHIFGIKYSEDIKVCGASAKEIAISANINESYGTEIQKGIKLAKYVDIK